MLSCQSVQHVRAVPLGYQEKSLVTVNQLLCMLTVPAGSIPVLRHLRGDSLLSLFCSNFQGMVFWCSGEGILCTLHIPAPQKLQAISSHVRLCSGVVCGLSSTV